MALYIDYGIYGDGDIYEGDVGAPAEYVANQEVHAHYLAVIIRYTAALVPGGTEAFKIHQIVPREAIDRQGSFTHEAFLDRVEASNQLSFVIKHTGSEFIISHVQLLGQRKKHQPKG